MLLREWLTQIGARSVERSSLNEIQHFEFGEDRYVVKMQDGREFQDNDLGRILSMIRDEFHAQQTTATLTGRERMHPAIEYPFIKGKPQMHIRPVVWTSPFPPPDLDMLVEQLERNVTFFNLTGQFQQPMKKDNL